MQLLPTTMVGSYPRPAWFTHQLAGRWCNDNRMLDDYYDLHGWERKTSFPIRETLTGLDLGYVADDLEKIGEGRHERVVVDRDKFLGKVNRKSGGAP